MQCKLNNVLQNIIKINHYLLTSKYRLCLENEQETQRYLAWNHNFRMLEILSSQVDRSKSIDKVNYILESITIS